VITFARPIWLVLLLALPVIAYLALRLSYASLGPYQKWLSLVVRIAVWVLLVCSLAGIQFVHKSDRVSVVIVRDSSDSVDQARFGAVEEELDKAMKGMRRDDSLGKVNFGSSAYLEYLPQPGVSERMLKDWQTKPRTNFTDIAEGIRLAVASFPENAQKRLVLITDGNENAGSALAEARVARDNGVELLTVPLPSRTGPEVLLSSLDAPSTASLGETVAVRFVVESTVATPVTVTLSRGGQYVDKAQINVRPGKEVYEFPVGIDQSGFLTYELDLEPKLDTIAENNRAYAFVVVAGQPRLLYATGDPQEARFLPSVLHEHNIAVDFVPPGGIPYSLADFQLYDGIVFSDVAAYDVSTEQMQMIQSLVRDFGRGFLMIGGEKSFGPGGYFETPIEETLPVDMDFRRKRITPSTLVVCLVDKSGSMGETVNGVEKVVMAREACKAVVKLQQASDWVGVMGFDAVGQWVAEPAQGINKEETLAKLSAMQAGGGTDLYPAMQAAWDSIKGIPAQIKHFLVFTDGIVAPADFEGLTKEMRGDNITISTVAFGTDADVKFLADLAKMGGGNAYTANSLYDLPRIFTREVFLANKATLSETPFRARMNGDSPLVSAIPWAGSPLLYGYVATAAKERAQVPLLAEKEDPLLAVWRYGLGKSAAFTSDAKNRWARDWLGWGGYSRLWTGIARWLRSDLDSGGMDVQTSVSGSEGVISVSAMERSGEFVNLSRMEAHVTDPELKAQTVELRQTAPGQYEGRFPITDNGNYFVNVVQYGKQGDGGEAPEAAQASGLAVSYSPEYRELRTNTFLLNQLQTSSLAPEGLPLEDLFTKDRKPVRRLEDAWELFTLLAIILWLVDVAARRLVLDWMQWQAVFASVFTGGGVRRALRVREGLALMLAAKARAQAELSRGSADEAVQLRRQTLSGQAEARVRAGGSAAASRMDVPAGEIRAPSEAGKRDRAAAPDLADLRRRMKGREADAAPKEAPVIPGALAGSAPAARQAKPTPQEGRPLTEREFTSKLLDVKRRREKRE